MAEELDHAPVVLQVRAWWDPDLALAGVDPRSLYAETFWLPLVGPSTLLLVRWAVHELGRHPDGFSVDAGDVAACLGLGSKVGPNSTVERTLARARRFHLARGDGELLEVRAHLPRLHAGQVSRLPARLQAAHAETIGAGR